MGEYAPKRRTALVLAGSGTSGAYHAGVLKALDESGVKIDLMVGSGVGSLGAAFGAAAGGARLYREGGFWDGLRWSSLYRLRPALRIALLLLGSSFGVFLLPLGLAILAGLLFPLGLLVSLAAPGAPSGWLASLTTSTDALQATYVAAFAAPVFLLAVLAVVVAARQLAAGPRRLAETLEAALDVRGARQRLREGLWQLARGSALSGSPPADAEIGRRFVALLTENLGQPGFRELVLRTADLETGGTLAFTLLADEHREGFPRVRGSNRTSLDLRAPGCAPLLFDAVMTGLLPPLVTPVQRVRFPRGGPYGGQLHRLTESTLAGGVGLSEALAAGAEQVVLVGAVPESASPPAVRRGLRALVDSALATLERQALDRELNVAETINRLVSTLGHETGSGRAWEDPATGRLYREVGIWVVRPERRILGPLELDGGRDPATEVEQGVGDLVEQGYRDAYRQFVEPVVGAAPDPEPPEESGVDAPEEEASLRVEL
jgi:predicted acylesterase/phospholipase RssA